MPRQTQDIDRSAGQIVRIGLDITVELVSPEKATLRVTAPLELLISRGEYKSPYAPVNPVLADHQRWVCPFCFHVQPATPNPAKDCCARCGKEMF